MTTLPAPAFERPNEDRGVHAARERFFHAVHRVQPRVSNDLMGEPLALYRPIYEERMESHRTGPQLGWSWAMDYGWLPDWSHFQYATDVHDPQSHVQLRELLLKWSRRWRLADSWCLEAAVETLAMMSADESGPLPVPLYYLGTRMVELPFAEEEMKFSFQSRGWEPTLENWGSAAARMTEKFNRELQLYRERVENLARDEGLVQPRGERTRKGDHLEWLARYVVGYETYDEIAAAVGATRQAVEPAVQAKAVAIDLTIPHRQTSVRS